MKPISLRGHERPISTVKINFDGDLLFSGSIDKLVNLWDSYTGERIGSYLCSAAVKTLDVTVDSEWLVAGTLNGSIEFFKVNGGKHVRLIQIDALIRTLEFSYGGKELLVLAEWFAKDKKDVEFIIYDFRKIEEMLIENSKKDSRKSKDEQSREALVIKPEKVLKDGLNDQKFSQIAWGYLNKTIIGAKQNGNLEVYNLKGESILSVKAFGDQINSFSIVKDFSLMIVNSNEGSKIFDPETLECLKTFKTEVPMNAGCISPLIYDEKLGDKKVPKYHAIIGGGVLARDAARTKAGGFEIRLVNIIYEEELGLIPGHFGPVNSLCFHNDGRGFCSGGEEGIIRIFRFDKNYFSEFE